MNVDNFIVRPKRRAVEKYAKPGAWTALSHADRQELAQDVAGLPSELDPEAEEAKRFDLLILNLQLAILKHEPSFKRLRDQVIQIGGLLEDNARIPMIQAQMETIQDIQSDEWWQDVTVPMLDRVRRRLRDLIRLIEKQARKLVYTDFEDEMGPAVTMPLPGLADRREFERFRAKAQVFLRAHLDHVAIRKLRMNKPLTPTDLVELERILVESGAGGPAELARAKADSEGLGVFVRSLVGLDREAAKEALAEFSRGKTLMASQLEFLGLIVDHLTEYGMMDPALLYESPFIDIASQGPDGLFTSAEVEQLFQMIHQVRGAAVAA